MIYLRVFVTMLLVFWFRVVLFGNLGLTHLSSDVHPVIGFLGVLSGVYAILVAFMMFVVWEQYNRVQTTIIREAALLEDLSRTMSFTTS